MSRLVRLLAGVLSCLAPCLATASQADWPVWQTIIYQQRNAAQLATLKRLGVTAGMVFASRNDAAGNPLNPAARPLARAGLRFYVENIATDFYAAYHRWSPDQPPNAAFLAVQALHQADPADPAAFIRAPSLSDPAWLHRVAARITRTVRNYEPFHPLYYSLADEPGIADLAANWDFDVSPDSLAGMRVWLRQDYGSLKALNREWNTGFASWAEVTPELTDEAVRQKGENFARWADFKRWMDVAFAQAVRSGTNAVHAADPKALSAIEGAQIPGQGGYDYARLAGAVDVMEIYDMAQNIEIAHSLNPNLAMLVTVSGGDPEQMHRLWRAALRGMRGVILWDEHGALVGPDGAIGQWGKQAAPVFHQLRGPLGRLLLASKPVTDPVAILYSPASERTQWLLDRRAEGGAWENRGSEAEDESIGAVRAARRRFVRLVAAAGLQGRYTTSRLIEQGALRRGGIRLLLLPHVIALSPKAAAAIRRFVGKGGVVAADMVPGRFDQHGRRLPRPLLAEVFAKPIPRSGGAALLVSLPHGGEATADATLFARAGLKSGLHLSRPGGTPIAFSRPGGHAASKVALFRYQSCGVTILALQRNFPSGATAEPVVLHLPAKDFVYDLGKNRGLGQMTNLALSLDPVTPAILALSRTKLSGAPALLNCGPSSKTRSEGSAP